MLETAAGLRESVTGFERTCPLQPPRSAHSSSFTEHPHHIVPRLVAQHYLKYLSWATQYWRFLGAELSPVPKMTSAPPNASTPSGKSLHISSSHMNSPLQQQQITSPSFESSSRRSSGFNNQILASPRNSQSKKKSYKSSKRPQLADEDTMAESVRAISRC